MTITGKTKMKDYDRIKPILRLALDFEAKVRTFAVPKRIGKVEIKVNRQIQIQHLMQLWNVKEEQQLFELTAKAYGLNVSKINEYPLIDFLRLVYDAKDAVDESVKLFETLKRTNKNEKIQAILDKYKSSPLGMLDRFVLRSNGAYNHDQAAECSWYIVYEAFNMDTQKYDIDLEINEAMKP
jgi:hypothetical protein